MQDIRLAFRQLLIADPAVNALSGERIYPVQMPQGQRSPSLVYFRVFDTADYHMLGDSGLQRISMQLNAWADKDDAAVTLADAALDAITGFRGFVDTIRIHGIFHSAGRDLHDDIAQLFAMSRDFQIIYDKLVPGFVVLSVNLSTTTLNMPASNAGDVIGAVTLTTNPPGGNSTVTIGGPDAILFALTNGGLTPCNLIVGASNIPAGSYNITLTAV